MGLFAHAFMKHFPLIPVEEEGRLHDPKLRENFIESLFTLKRWRDMECSLEQMVDFATHGVFVGKIRETYTRERVLTDGGVDIAKVKPLLFDMNSKKYWAIGEELGNCWSVGKQLKKK